MDGLELPEYKFTKTKIKLIELSKNLLLTVKKSNSFKIENVEELLHELSVVDYEDLLLELNNDELRKTFWINIYNAFVKIKLLTDPKDYPKFSFFEESNIDISNLTLSLDDIEHKILRRSQIKLLRGYVSRFWCLPRWEYDLRLRSKDYRIHFGLNCGAKSCPPISSYDENKIDEQLEKAKISFVKNDSEFNEEKLTLTVSMIFYWFLGDFGGTQGVINIHRDMKIIPSHIQVNRVSLLYREYNWDIEF